MEVLNMLNITKVKKNSENIVEEILTDNLYDIYNFMSHSTGPNTLLHEEDITNLLDGNFYKLTKEKVNLIFHLCEKYELNEKEDYNFTISEDGKITLGFNMKLVKRDLESLKDSYNKFLNREFYNVIEFSIQ